MILVGGEALIDFIQVADGSDLPRYQANPGGSPYNVAIALGKQGCDVGFATPMSNDTLGQLLSDTIKAAGVKVLTDEVKDPTSLAVVSIIDGQPAYQFYREGTADRQINVEGLKALTPDTVKAFQVGSLGLTSGDDAEAWADYFVWLKEDKGALVSIDPNIRAPFIKDRAAYLARLDRMLATADVVKLSDEDLEWISPDLSLGDAAKALKAKSAAKLFVLTKGAEGAVALFKGEEFDVAPQPPEQMGDTVGAGDTFMATMLGELDRRGALKADLIETLSVDDMKAALNRCAKAAGINVSRHGCNPPTLAELNA